MRIKVTIDKILYARSSAFITTTLLHLSVKMDRKIHKFIFFLMRRIKFLFEHFQPSNHYNVLILINYIMYN